MEKLVLRCKDVELCFLVSPPSESTIITLPNDYAPESIEKADPCPNQSRFWDVNSIFPNLHSLELSGSENFLTDVDIPFLPRTLTELRLLMSSWPNPSLLPPQLEIFSLSSNLALFGAELAALPRSLRNIEAHLAIWDVTEWALLPPALENAKFDGIYSSVLSATIVPYLEGLPLKQLGEPMMTLEDSLNAPWMSQLPSTLTKLNFSRSEFPISSIVIKSLPRGIKTLLLKRIVGEDLEEGQNLFPPKLTSLALSELPKARETCDILMKCLPQTLKSFSAKDAGENIKPFELLPPSVTFCSIFSRCVSHAPVITLPEGIRDFEAYTGYEKDEMPLYIFPRGLTHLSTCGFPSLELLKSLPQTLTQLKLAKPVEPEILDLLPSGLQILSLKIDGEVNATHFERFTVLKSCAICTIELEAKYFRGTFPSSLRTLHLEKVVEHTKILELPGSLQELAIEIDAELTNEIVQQLPRSLRSLILKVRGRSRVTDDAKQWFPPHLPPSDISIHKIPHPWTQLRLLSSLYP